jgi:3-oxo-5-alpha-steroid 4-dehydrogenase 1
MDRFLNSSAQELLFLETVSWAMIFLAPLIFFILCYQTAPYGRYAKHASKWWGPDVPAKLAWVVQELPSFLWPLYFLIVKPPESPIATSLLLCFLAHYFHRIFIFSLRIRSKNPTKMVPFLMAFCFCFLNGYLQSTYLVKYFSFELSSASLLIHLFGMLIFFLGMAINIHSDTILRKLRRPGESSHKIPRGGLFEKVSGANFFGEIVEWWGFAIMSGFSLPAIAFACFTFANIGARGMQHHRYYLAQFPDYPKNRRAVIPYIW